MNTVKTVKLSYKHITWWMFQLEVIDRQLVADCERPTIEMVGKLGFGTSYCS